MEILNISADEYEQIVGNEVYVYCRKSFLELNKDKVDRIHFLVGKDSKYRIALAIGEKDNRWCAPFSAPFANIVLLRDDITVENIWDFVMGVNEYARNNGAISINIYPPADCFDYSSNARLYNALLGNGYRMIFDDINYSFNLVNIDLEEYASQIKYSARKSLNKALRSELSFVKCETISQKEEAYDVIKANREYRGFPLRMSKEQLMNTIQIVDHDFFLVKKDAANLASAVVYRLTKDIAQIVYWGNMPDSEKYCPINFISYELIKYCKNLGFKMLDVGISTEEGKPNYGLCTFKENIGCIPSMKAGFKCDFKEAK